MTDVKFQGSDEFWSGPYTQGPPTSFEKRGLAIIIVLVIALDAAIYFAHHFLR